MAKDLLYTRLMNSPEWREIRAGMQEKHPFCELHEKRGIKVPATCIHHIREVESGQTEAESRELCYNPENLIALCAYCHNEIHKRKRSHSRENVKQRQRNRTARIIARWENKVTGSVEAPLPSGYSFLQARQKLEEEAAAFLPPCPTEGSLSTHRKAVGGLFPIGTGTYQAQQEKGSHGADTGLSGESYSGK